MTINLSIVKSLTFHVLPSHQADCDRIVKVSLDILPHLRIEHKVETIVKFRNRHGLGLLQAKQIVDTLFLLAENSTTYNNYNVEQIVETYSDTIRL